MVSATLNTTRDQSAERVDWTYVNGRIADATALPGSAHHLAVQRDAADAAARLMTLVQRAHQIDHEGRR